MPQDGHARFSPGGQYARAAVEIEPTTGNYWNTLGVALYRNGEWDTACDALYRSMQLRGNGGDSFDWFFLAMIDHKQGRETKRRANGTKRPSKWYHAQPSANDEELFRFQIEAAGALGFPKPTVRPPRHVQPTAMPVFGPDGLRRARMSPLKTQTTIPAPKQRSDAEECAPLFPKTRGRHAAWSCLTGGSG